MREFLYSLVASMLVTQAVLLAQPAMSFPQNSGTSDSLEKSAESREKPGTSKAGAGSAQVGAQQNATPPLATESTYQLIGGASAAGAESDPLNTAASLENAACDQLVAGSSIADAKVAQASSNGAKSVKDKDEDTANKADTVKSWTSQQSPGTMDKGFLNSLQWQDYKVGIYVLRMGKIYSKWVAAMQWMRNGKLVLTEYTPPMEYVSVVDPRTGRKTGDVVARDVNSDGAPEIAFIHEKLNDPNYHMYAVYSLTKNQATPKLLWKSGGKFGDWLNKVETPAGEVWKSRATHED